MDRSHPPTVAVPRRAAFPHLDRGRLGNGVDVYLVANHAQPIVSLRVVLRCGGADDGRLTGLANFVATMLQSGAGERDTSQIAAELELIGAEFDAGAGRDETSLRLVVLKRHLPAALAILDDILRRPHFPEEEIERERQKIIADIRQNRCDAGYLASTQIRRELYRGTRYASEIDGTPESLRRIGRSECHLFHRQHYTPANAFIVAAGDIDIDELIGLLDRHLGSWTAEPAEADWPSARKRGGHGRIVVVDRPDALQTSFRIGRRAVRRNDGAFIPLVVLSTLFGGYFNSRLNRNLREVHGFTYGAQSNVEALGHAGIFSCGASVGGIHSGRAVEETLAELHRIHSEPITPEELDMVKRYLIGSQALQLETPGQAARFVRTMVLYGLPFDYYVRFPAIVEALTSEQLLHTATEWLAPEAMTIVLCGGASTIGPQIEHLGPHSVIDPRGRAIGRLAV